ncbi:MULTISPECIES: hypothetical protein [Cyanophyceae]|uniref:hypothetical protein n=1 Tax=Cyanophyceae TaxID=3028117 RepID=UPI001689FC3F|nr:MULTISPECIES: hypothetical protein [Cyanophyceae]MBD1918849.1 hypothetical protein [Phormidium sp. FACHB-77]MBD2033308.1 hypothetical protein [Phormidium sp. FACHB-322]MBD2053759.1 hypothetical protein [Leptolyngbya sp. FACHB-60]
MTTYKFLTTGDLEIPVRGGFRIIPGCSCKGIFEFGDRMAELQELLEGLEEGDERPIEALYREHQRFAWLVGRALELNGIDPDWVRPSDLGWLLFGHQGDDGPVSSPLLVLNAAAEPRYPRKPSTEQSHNDFISLLAAIAAQPDTSAEEAFRLATSEPARVVLGMLEDRAWHSMSAEEKDDTRFKAWAGEQREKAAAAASGGWGKQQRPADLPRAKAKG